MSDAPVDDAEILHRSVPTEAVAWTSAGWHLSSEAFNDRSWKPSVDRRNERPNAEESKKAQSDGIAQLLAYEIRECNAVIQNPDAPEQQQVAYKLDVKPDPIEEGNPENLPANPAHALVECAPALANKSRFKKVKEALCRLAERRDWVIQPLR
jgi:hypothetical protein